MEDALQCTYFPLSTTYLINGQDGINEQEGNFSKISTNPDGMNMQGGQIMKQ